MSPKSLERPCLRLNLGFYLEEPIEDHTHPDNSAQPSPTDEETFLRVFGKAEWALIFILAKENQSY
ncbi:MAG: hypothetical protein COA78_16200 [Blastopirellula sp.]|nr:MAG: hypothetical protein COA78_16200 [Blastopirellula sp.]